MADLTLPRDLTKGDVVRTVDTPTDYWNLIGAGFTPVELTPQQKAAVTRRLNREKSEQNDNSQEGTKEPAGNGTGDES